jgi:hypothetical protein
MKDGEDPVLENVASKTLEVAVAASTVENLF